MENKIIQNRIENQENDQLEKITRLKRILELKEKIIMHNKDIRMFNNLIIKYETELKETEKQSIKTDISVPLNTTKLAITKIN